MAQHNRARNDSRAADFSSLGREMWAELSRAAVWTNSGHASEDSQDQIDVSGRGHLSVQVKRMPMSPRTLCKSSQQTSRDLTPPPQNPAKKKKKKNSILFPTSQAEPESATKKQKAGQTSIDAHPARAPEGKSSRKPGYRSSPLSIQPQPRRTKRPPPLQAERE